MFVYDNKSDMWNSLCCFAHTKKENKFSCIVVVVEVVLMIGEGDKGGVVVVAVM